MNLLFSILRAGHASGTHHKLALDALQHVSGAYCESWQRLFLKHGGLYLEGSKAPDTQFKDFKNHVLHVRNGLWGGAPEKAANWYQHLLAALRDKNWSEAAWCAGVLSHYYTDPIHPFHTGQSDAENNVHRAVEWSISRSYDTLAGLGAEALPAFDLELGEGDDWLRELMIAGATRANRQYEALLAHYDFHRGVVDPPSGLDQTAQAFVGELIRYAILSFAQVLQRAFKESAVVPPDVRLTAETIIATIQLPLKVILKRIDDKTVRRQVEAMYDELQATGRVETAMPEDERILRALHAKEVLALPGTLDTKEALASNKTRSARGHRPVVPNMQPAAGDREVPAATARMPARAPSATPPAPPVSDIPPRSSAKQAMMPEKDISAAPAPVRQEPISDPIAVSAPLAAAAAMAAASALSGLGSAGLASRLRSAAPQPTETDKVHADSRGLTVRSETGVEAQAEDPPEAQATPAPPLTAEAAPTAAALVVASETPSSLPRPPVSRPTRPAPAEPARSIDPLSCHLSPEHDIVDAPSIGPKTAERLKAVGLETVADLFAADPGALAEQLDIAHIRAKTIAEWQDQARLVCEIPGLRGTHAQLLVGAGYRDLRRIARTEPREVSTDLLRFIQTAEGQRILRSGGAPDLEKIISWVKAAERAWAAKAA